MPLSRKEVKSLFYKIEVSIEEIEETVEERSKLHELDLQPSANDNAELNNLVHKTIENFELVQAEIETHYKDNDLYDQLKDLADRYADIYQAIQNDSNIDASEFHYEIPKSSKTAPAKAVRFKDVPNEADTSEMMGTQPFQPYRDDPDEAVQEEEEEEDSRTNHQMFAAHQQTMMRQDQDLDYLHQSISRQHMMGKDIDQELDDQLIILNDLEQGVDNSSLRIQRATTRLNDFRRMARENGSLTTIIILTIILILLLVVLN
ncbi:hypothetical protein CANMA_002892 [Candida margitis]|uniref:uncharacterized protein n=1 Tax=Candida margitis TaxID=1775924 RepID=UPI002225CCBE|nr:uncharacterized protein CANMA_002892 [Candida margitis]KAI5967712.1 hypothetical protein CANMA_002892 [Candida margitis]